MKKEEYIPITGRNYIVIDNELKESRIEEIKDNIDNVFGHNYPICSLCRHHLFHIEPTSCSTCYLICRNCRHMLAFNF